MVKNKKAFEMDFAWVFAIIVGAIILVFAIYFAYNLVKLNEKESNTKAAREFVNILDPLQTSIEEGKMQKITTYEEIKMYNECYEDGEFGSNLIRVSTRKKFGSGGGELTWTKSGGDIRTNSHYLFSKEETIGNEFYFFVLPFSIPYKTADLMIVYSGKYCFVSPPDNIEEIINGLGGENKNLYVEKSVSGCENDATKVCFVNSGDCDVLVRGNCNYPGCQDIYESGSVSSKDEEGENKEVMYVGNLLYPAIFGDEEIYECNVKRIMKRNNLLTELYIEKSKFISSKGCLTNFLLELTLLYDMTKNFKDSSYLTNIYLTSKEIDEKNQGICRLY